MSSFTSYTGPNRYENIGTTYNMTLQDVIDYGYDIGLTDYPIWDETKREWLNDRIVDHFRFREIRAETPAMFINWLNRLMNENMNSINPVFELTLDADIEDLRNDFNLTSYSTMHGEDENETDSTGTSTSESYSSTNPRQTMVGKDPTHYYDAGTKGNTSSTSNATSTNTSDGTTNTATTGYSNSDLPSWLSRWESTITNGLTLVFAILESAFCQLYTDHFNVW